jgi:N-acetylglutamate synthase
MTLVLEIEETAFRAWPAEEVVELSGWRLRFTHGVTRRANSVWPNGWQDETPLVERMEAVEAFAAARGIAPSFQLTTAARPPELDAFLEERGYAFDTPVIVKTLALSSLDLEDRGLGVRATVASQPNAEWLSVAVDRGRYAGVRDVFLGILARIGDRGGFALVRSGHGPLAAGLGVVDREWLGIFAMLTVPEARRRGAARAILGALTRWGANRGATRAYLQVERDNAPARALYQALGFVRAYDYHYRTKFDEKKFDGC